MYKFKPKKKSTDIRKQARDASLNEIIAVSNGMTERLRQSSTDMQYGVSITPKTTSDNSESVVKLINEDKKHRLTQTPPKESFKLNTPNSLTWQGLTQRPSDHNFVVDTDGGDTTGLKTRDVTNNPNVNLISPGTVPEQNTKNKILMARFPDSGPDVSSDDKKDTVPNIHDPSPSFPKTVVERMRSKESVPRHNIKNKKIRRVSSTGCMRYSGSVFNSEHMYNRHRRYVLETSDNANRRELLWTNQIENVIKGWHNNCLEFADKHKERYKHHKRVFLLFAIPAAIIPLILAAFEDMWGNECGGTIQRKILLVLVGILNVFLGVINPGNRAAAHLNFESSYNELAVEITGELVKPQRHRQAADVFIQRIMDRYNSLNNRAPET